MSDEAKTTDDWRPRVVDPDAVWPGECGHCGFRTNARACPRCGLHAGVEYRKSHVSTPHQPTDPIRLLLSEGLDLCVRARKLDKAERDLVEWQMRNPHITRSATIPIWEQEQYERDLADWEARARRALS